MLLPPHEIHLLPYSSYHLLPKELKFSLWGSLSHPPALTLVLLVLRPLYYSRQGIYDTAPSLLIFVFLSPVVDIFSYSALLTSPAPSTDLDKLNEWMAGVGGIAARAGICVCPWVCKMLSAL